MRRLESGKNLGFLLGWICWKSPSGDFLPGSEDGKCIEQSPQPRDMHVVILRTRTSVEANAPEEGGWWAGLCKYREPVGRSNLEHPWLDSRVHEGRTAGG